MLISMSAQEFSEIYGKSVPRRILLMRHSDDLIEVSMIKILGTYVVAFRSADHKHIEFVTGDLASEVYAYYRDVIINKEDYLYA